MQFWSASKRHKNDFQHYSCLVQSHATTSIFGNFGLEQNFENMTCTVVDINPPRMHASKPFPQGLLEDPKKPIERSVSDHTNIIRTQKIFTI